MPFIDLQESQDRRLQMLLQTANQIQQNKIARDEVQVRRDQLASSNREVDLKDPTKNKYLRAQMAVENRSKLADARYKDNMPSFQAKQDAMLARQLALEENRRNYKESEQSPMNSDTAGRYEFAKESLRNIPKLRSMLFSGENGAFRQDVATKLMYPWRYPKDKEVQDAKRWVIGMATARGLIQSGTVVKDNEWGRLMQQFGIDAFSDPESINNALTEQENFMTGFKKSIRPGSEKSVTSGKVGDVAWEVIE